MLNAQVDTVQIEVPRKLFRAMHSRPLNLLVSALTGVSVSFCPLFLYELGRDKVSLWDWRVLANFAVIVLVPGVYMSFGAPVLARAWKSPTDASSRANLGFWLLFAVIGVVIWAATNWFSK
jgi:hypothetical protein